MISTQLGLRGHTAVQTRFFCVQAARIWVRGLIVTFGITLLILSQALAVSISFSTTSPTCSPASGSDGSITAVPSGGTAPYTYQWDVWADSATTATVSNLIAGDYEVTVTDALGATASAVGTIAPADPANTGVHVLAQYCNDTLTNLNDYFYINGLGGAERYQYEILDTETGELFYEFSSSAGQNYTYFTFVWLGSVNYNRKYTVRVRAKLAGCWGGWGSKCDITTPVVIPPTQLTSADCNSTLPSVNEYFYVDFVPGAQRYQYEITDGAGFVANPLSPEANPTGTNYSLYFLDGIKCATTYNVRVRVMIDSIWSAYGPTCTLTVPNYDELLSNLSITGTTSSDDLCGNSSGSATVQFTGSNAPMTFSWSGAAAAQTTATATGLLGGTYTVTVADSNACFVSTPVTVGGLAPLTPSVSVTTESCNPTSDATATMNFSGGTAPFTYAWGGAAAAQTTQTATGLIAGFYQSTVTDANGCTAIASNSVVQAVPGTLTATSSNLSCYQSNDGTIDLTMTGGTAPFSYLWNDAATDEDRSALSAGNYQVTVTDSYGCVSRLPGDAGTSISLWTAEGDATDALGSNDGTEQGSTIYSGGDCSDAFELDGLDSYIEVADDASLQVGTSFTISAWFQTWDVAQEDPNTGDVKQCVVQLGMEDADGSSVMIGLEDETAYFGSYLEGFDFDPINGGENIDDDTWYHLAVTYDGTTAILYLNGEEEDQLDVPIDISGVSGVRIGSFYNPAEDLTNFYFYGLIDEVRLFGNALSYAEINDIMNAECAALGHIEITEPDEIVASLSETTVPCSGTTVGSLSSSVSGGVAPYSYSWNTGAITSGLSGQTNGSYTVTITDAIACTKVLTADITNAGDNPTATMSTTIESCVPATDGTVTATLTAGTAPFTFAWNGAATGQTTSTVTGLQAGFYQTTVTDALGCVGTGSISLVQAIPGVISASSTNLSCYQSNDGTIDLTMTGGTAPFSYLWNDAATDEDRSALSAGNYQVTVTDSYGCVSRLPGDAGTSISLWTAEGDATDALGSNDGTEQGSTIYSGGDCSDAFELDGLDSYIEVADDASLQVGTSFTISAWFQTWDVAQEDPNTGDVKQCVVQLGMEDADGSSVMIGLEDETAYFGSYLEGFDFDPINGGENIDDDTWYHLAVTYDGTTAILYLNGEEEDQLDVPIDISGVSGVRIGSFYNPAEDLTNFYFYGLIDEVRLFGNALSYAEINDIMNAECAALGHIEITEPDEIVASLSETTVPCSGSTAGALESSVSGGSAPYTYAWTTGGINADLTGAANGTYTVTITDAIGCTKSLSADIEDAGDAVGITISTVQESCNPGTDGSATVTVTSGSAPFTYAWNAAASSQTTATATGLASGSYSVTIVDAIGCNDTGTANVGGSTAGTLSYSKVDETCFGANDGSIDVTLTGGTAPFSFSWLDGATTEDRTGITSGNYSATVTDANNCELTTGTINVTGPAGITVSITETTVPCTGPASGVLVASVGGGSTPYSYNWSSGASVATASGLFNTSYTITVTDAVGCSKVASQTVFKAAANPTISLSSTIESCSPGSDGSASVSGTGGTGPFTYTWTGAAAGQNSSTATGLTAGTYSLTVTDTYGCTANDNVLVPAATAATLSEVSSAPSCFGNNNGSIDLTVSGGNAPLAFLWSDGATTEDRSSLAGGTYQVTVNDLYNCSVSLPSALDLSGPDNLLVTITETTVACSGDNSGTLASSVTGGTAPYTYNWMHGPTTANVGSLSNGNYTLAVTDNNGCNKIVGGTVTIASNPPALAPTTTLESCSPGSDGTVVAAHAGGLAPFTYSWSGSAAGQTTQTATGLNAGTYSMTVTDAEGCTDNSSAIVASAVVGSASSTSANLTCNSSADATIDVTVAGGNAPFAFVWNDASTTEDRSGLSAGSYTVTITDLHGCQIVEGPIALSEPTAIAISFVETDAACGTNNGAIDVSVSGGSLPYLFSWSGGQTVEDLASLPAGTYTVTVQDATGCTENSTAVVAAVGSVPTLATSSTDATCAGNDGTATVVAVGGTAPYTYLWDDGSAQTTATATGLAPGTFAVSVYTADGCAAFDNTALGGGSGGLAVSIATTVQSCGASDGTATAAVVGGSMPYSYQWGAASANQVSITATGLDYGYHHVVVTDAAGCTATDTGLVVQYGATIPLTQVAATYCNQTLTNITDYFWLNTVAGAQRYQIEVTDGGGFYGTLFSNYHNQTAPFFSLFDLPGIESGTDYNVRARLKYNGCWGNWGSVCIVSTPPDPDPTQLAPAYCGGTLTSINQYFYASAISGAQRYQFEISFGGSVVASGFSPSYSPSNPIFSFAWVSGIQYGTTYQVRVRVKVAGTWLNWGPDCNLSTPAPIVPQVQTAYCGTTLGNQNDYWYIDGVPGAERYSYEITDCCGYLATPASYYTAPTSTWMTFALVSGIQPNTTYNIRVKAKIAGVWGNYGPTCTISTPAAKTANNQDLNAAIVAQPDLLLYPNPNNGQFWIHSVAFDSDCAITVTDVSGKVLWKRNQLGGLQSGTEINLKDVAAGVYFLSVKGAAGTRVERIVVK